MLSLARGFMSGGAQSIITTLWNANDLSSSQIMGHTFDGLKSKQSAKDIALQQAQIAYLNNIRTVNSSAHPKFWAHLFVIGNTAPLSAELVSGSYTWMLLLFGVLGLGIWWFMKRSH